ncbi:MAG TPA: metallophosphoesterase, partial [Chloroflexota bacterium]|nr:metallophosphoesterase [Chloroflexota bacterium]
PDAYAGYFNLHGRSWTGSGITVVGFEGCRAYNGGPHQYSERDMSRRVRKSTHGLSKVDLVVTHAPPLGCNDLNDTCHQGFACFRDLVQRCHPQYFVHGHTHLYSGSRRLSVLDGTTTVNAHGHYLLTL